MEKNKASLIFLGILAILLSAMVLFGLEQLDIQSSKDLIPLSAEQVSLVRECQGNSEFEVVKSSKVCYVKSESKHDIVLLATFPLTGNGITRTIYEHSSNFTTYSQYNDGESSFQALSFQTGPWLLYCKGNPSTGECNGNPPPWDVPLLVSSNYPLFDRVCGEFGYPLPRHERVVHIVQNPIDSIEAWYKSEYSAAGLKEFWNEKTISKYVDAYGEWHSFWQSYPSNYPEVPTYWIRYEDLCLCLKPAMAEILEFTNVFQDVHTWEFDEILESNPCSESKFVGKGLFAYTKSELEYINEKFAPYLKHFGYTDLMHQFLKHHTSPTSEQAREAFQKALWPELRVNSHPSDQYCAQILSVEWNWNNDI